MGQPVPPEKLLQMRRKYISMVHLNDVPQEFAKFTKEFAACVHGHVPFFTSERVQQSKKPLTLKVRARIQGRRDSFISLIGGWGMEEI